jgi:hypothetical protein
MRAKQFIRKIREAAGDGDVANAVVAEVIKLIGEGHTEVSPDVITTKVSASLGRPFMLKDLVAANNASPELQHYIDSINPSKIKFSTDILTVKNQDPVKEKERSEAGVASMASRAASRPRLGEGIDDAAKDADYNTGHKKGRADAKAGKPNNSKECISAQERKGYTDGYKSLKESDQGISKDSETKFHKKLDKLVHDTFGRRKEEMKEGWGRGTDRVTIPDDSTLYWSGKGPLQKEYDALYNELVPSQGKADTIEGEVLRAASKIVYRHYNDGDEFNQASFEQLVPYIGAVTSYDDLAHKSTEFAMKANGNYTPNPNWDSLDVMEYGPEEDDYDEEDDDWDDEYEDPNEEDEDEDEELDEVVNWPKEVPSDASQEQDDEDEPHPYGHDLDEARTTWNSDWYVYNPETLAVKKKFRTYKGAKQYAEANGLKLAASEWYHDKINTQKQTDEGWESGPEERSSRRERDPDDAYDDMRQQKADAEAQAQQARRPQEHYYTLTGRGPNMEPNYAFPGEYSSQEEAVAARARLMADPKTPNPRMIGISKRTRYLGEGRETPLRDLEDYSAKKKVLQDIQTDPHTGKDLELTTELIRRLAGLEKQKSELK